MINQIIHGDALDIAKTLPNESIDCCITSPPYFCLRTYGVEGQYGLETTPEEYVDRLVVLFREIRRALKKESVFWLNLGDSYAGSGGPGSQYDNKSSNSFKGEFEKYKNPNRKVSNLKPKDLIGIPWRVAFALQADGWWLRQDIVWEKPNPMPESVTDRCTKSHEYVFLLTKSDRYYFNNIAIQEKANYDGRKDEMMKGSMKYKDGVVPGKKEHTFALKGHKRWNKNELGQRVRNKRSVWTINTEPYKDAHFATFPTKLIEPMVLAGCPKGGVILDPFMGSGTTALVAREFGRNYIGIELNQEYIKLANRRLKIHQKRLF